MNFIKSLSTNVIKYFKGLLAIALLWFLPAFGVFIFDSCKKSNYGNSEPGKAARKFNEVLNAVRKDIGPIVLENKNDILSRGAVGVNSYYLDFPAETNLETITDFSSNITIYSLTEVLSNRRVSIDDIPNANADLTIQVPEVPIRVALQPLVAEAKNYLLAKGATSLQIIEMIQEEGAEEIDLIPFVKTLTAIEKAQYTVRNIKVPLISNANALPRFVECGIEALGMDALYSLMHSGATSWTWSTMKRVFKGVAKRFLGPIGVAVAVVEFGICML